MYGEILNRIRQLVVWEKATTLFSLLHRQVTIAYMSTYGSHEDEATQLVDADIDNDGESLPL